MEAPTPAACAPPRAGRGPASLLVTTFAVALGIRLLHLRLVAPIELGQPAEVGMDRWLNTHIAEAVARGSWLGGWSAAYDSSPGYSYILALLYSLSGRSWLGPLLVQALLGACTPLCLYALSCRLFSAEVGAVAAVLAALFTPPVFYEGLLVKFSLVPITVAAALLSLVDARERGRAGWFLAAGLALGLLVLLRPNSIVVAPVMVLWLAAPLRAKALGRAALLVGAGMGLVLGPMAVRDQAAAWSNGGSSLWGIHFYIGTNPDADGTYVEVHGVRGDIIGHVDDARRVAEEARGHALTPAGVSVFWFRKGLAFVRAQPMAYLGLQAKKLWHAFEADESGSFGDDFHEFRKASWVLRAPFLTFGSIAPLGLAGLAVSILRRRGFILPLFVATYVASMLPFFVAGRYRLPLVPPMLVLAAVGLVRMGEAVRRRGQGVFLVAVPILATAAVALDADVEQVLVLVATLILGASAADRLGISTSRGEPRASLVADVTEGL